jgi:hypothetical protein
MSMTVINALTVEKLGPRLFLTTFIGKMRWDIAERAYAEFVPMVTAMQEPVWISDATRLTGFDPSTLALGPRWFTAFKNQGGRYCLVASQWERTIMAARTMALGLGVRVRSYSSIDIAKDEAQQILSDPERYR